MRSRSCGLRFVLLVSWSAASSGMLHAAEPAFTEVRRFQAAEAIQGVAVDKSAFYAIANRTIARYDKASGKRLATWKADKIRPLIHLNHGIVRNNRLFCAHSNSAIPAVSSVEIFDTATLKHIGSHSFGIYEGSLTWIDWKDNAWWAVFAHYTSKKNLAGGHDTRWTTLVKFDAKWRRLQGWVFPESVVKKFEPNSCSGGGWGPDGRLYCSGHDAKELYILQLPKAGSTLELVGIAPISNRGQAFAWDKSAPGTIYGIDRPKREVVVSTLNASR